VTVEVVNQWDDTNTKQKERFDDDNDGVRGKTGEFRNCKGAGLEGLRET
jgi:hypothetical protein